MKNIEAERTLAVQGIEREQATEIANQGKAIVIPASSEAKSEAQATANDAHALAVNLEAIPALEACASPRSLS